MGNRNPVALLAVALVHILTGTETDTMSAITANQLIALLALTDAIEITRTARTAEIGAVLLAHDNQPHRLLVVDCVLIELRLAHPLGEILAVLDDDVAVNVLNLDVLHVFENPFFSICGFVFLLPLDNK